MVSWLLDVLLCLVFISCFYLPCISCGWVPICASLFTKFFFWFQDVARAFTFHWWLRNSKCIENMQLIMLGTLWTRSHEKRQMSLYSESLKAPAIGQCLIRAGQCLTIYLVCYMLTSHWSLQHMHDAMNLLQTVSTPNLWCWKCEKQNCSSRIKMSWNPLGTIFCRQWAEYIYF
jgi:hypothetical protein